MDLMKELYEAKETVGNEIGDLNKKIRNNGGKITGADVDMLDKLTHSMKSLATTCAMLEAEEEGYSGHYMPMPYGYSRNGNGYSGNGNGYSRNGNGYSGNGGGYSRRYSRESRDGYGYSGAGDMTERLRQMMDEAPDDLTRREIQKLMERMENQR